MGWWRIWGVQIRKKDCLWSKRRNYKTYFWQMKLFCKRYLAKLSYVNIAVKECKFSSHSSTDITEPETGLLFAISVELAISSVNISDNTFGVFLVESKVTLGASFATLDRQGSIQLSSGRGRAGKSFPLNFPASPPNLQFPSTVWGRAPPLFEPPALFHTSLLY